MFHIFRCEQQLKKNKKKKQIIFCNPKYISLSLCVCLCVCVSTILIKKGTENSHKKLYFKRIVNFENYKKLPDIDLILTQVLHLISIYLSNCKLSLCVLEATFYNIATDCFQCAYW